MRFFEMAAEHYLRSWEAQESLGDVAAGRGGTERAIHYYERGTGAQSWQSPGPSQVGADPVVWPTSTGPVGVESSEPLAIMRLNPAVVDAARRVYPGYLDRFPKLYGKALAALED